MTLTPAELTGLTITTLNDSNVSLSVSATQKDVQGDIGTLGIAIEMVTVNPTAPAVSSPTVSGVEGQPIALNLDAMIVPTGQTGDSNTIDAVTLTFTVPTGRHLYVQRWLWW